VVVDMNNRTAVAVLHLLIHHHLVQREGREKEQPPRAHGVLAVIDNHHAITLFNIEHLQALVPVVIAHRIGV